MPEVSVGTTAVVMFYGHEKRKTAVVTNEGTADEIVRIHYDNGQLASSAIPIYNRETYRISGKYAKSTWWVLSDTASTKVTWSDLRT